MSTTIRDLLVKLGVNADTESVEGFDSALSSLKDMMYASVAAAAALTAALAATVVSAANAGDAIDEGATRTGLSTDAYQRLAYVAGLAGMSVEEMEGAFSLLNKNVQAAVGKGEDFIETSNGIKISIVDANGELLTQEELLYATADAVAAAATEQDKLTIAQEVFGKSGASLVPLLEDGSAAMRGLATEAGALGAVMSGEDIEAAVALSDTMDALWASLMGLKNTIGLELVPIVTVWLTRIKEWYAANAELIGQKIDEYGDAVAAAFDKVATAIATVSTWIDDTTGWGPVFATVAAAVAAFATAMVGVAALVAWGYIADAIAAIGAVGLATFGEVIAIITAVGAAVVGLYLVIEDLVTYFQGGDSVIGRFLDTFRSSDGVLGAAARRFEQLIAIGMKVWEVVQKLGSIWYAVFSRTTLPVLKVLGAALLWLAEKGLGALGWYWDNVVGPMFDMFLAGLDMVLAAIDYITPKLAGLFGMMDAVLGGVGGALGIDLVPAVGGEAPAAGGTDSGASFAPSGAAFAPSVGEVASTSGNAFPGSSVQTTMQGNTYNITSSMNEEEVRSLIASEEERRSRDAAAVAGGGEV